MQRLRPTSSVCPQHCPPPVGDATLYFPQRPAGCRLIILNPRPSGWRSITWVQLLLNVALVEQRSSALDEKLMPET